MVGERRGAAEIHEPQGRHVQFVAARWRRGHPQYPKRAGEARRVGLRALRHRHQPLAARPRFQNLRQNQVVVSHVPRRIAVVLAPR